MKTVIDLSINTENQEVLKIGNHSRKWSNLSKYHFSISRSKRSPTRVVDFENS